MTRARGSVRRRAEHALAAAPAGFLRCRRRTGERLCHLPEQLPDHAAKPRYALLLAAPYRVADGTGAIGLARALAVPDPGGVLLHARQTGRWAGLSRGPALFCGQSVRRGSPSAPGCAYRGRLAPP